MSPRCAMSARRVSARRGPAQSRARAFPVPQPVFPSPMIVQRKCTCGGECKSCQGDEPEESHAFQTKASANEEMWTEFAKSKSESFRHFPSPTPATDPNQLFFHGFKRGRPLTGSNLLQWAEDGIWSDAVGDNRPQYIFSLLQRHKDVQLNAIWQQYLNNKVKMILASHEFDGSEEAREGGAVHLGANSKTVIDGLNHRAVTALVHEIKSTLRSGVIPRGATAITIPDAIETIEKSPEKGTVFTGRWGGTATVGFTWAGKRLVSTTAYSIIFEVIGHEGIYFQLSNTDFVKTEPFMQQVAETVYSGTRGIAVLGSFIKGFLSALASPVVLAADTAAKIIDMVSLGVAAGVKWTTGREISYTCLSSTCQNFNTCLKSQTKSVDDCKSDALKEALEEATIIVPLYRQGSECLNGDAEACGSIAALSIGLVENGLGRLAKRKGAAAEALGSRKALTKAEFEDAVIREAIDRPRPGDPHIAESLERPKPHQEPPPPAVKAPIHEEPRGTATSAKEAVKENVVNESARQAGSEVKLSDGTHGVAPYGEGEQAGFTFCSEHCTLVRKRLDQVLKTLPDNYPPETLRDINRLTKKVQGIDRELAKGRISKEQANLASHEIAREIAELAEMDPNLGQLLQMTPEYMEANRGQLRTELRKGAARARDIAKEFAERQERAPTPTVKSKASIERARRAGIPSTLIADGTVMTAADFPGLLPDRPTSVGRPSPKRIPPAGRPIGRSPVQNIEVAADMKLAIKAGAKQSSIRVNQWQVIEDLTAGTNRPDLYFELNGHRVHIEYDRFPMTRALEHARRILTNDPEAIVILKGVDH